MLSLRNVAARSCQSAASFARASRPALLRALSVSAPARSTAPADSHDDFKPKMKAQAGDQEALKAQIDAVRRAGGHAVDCVLSGGRVSASRRVTMPAARPLQLVRGNKVVLFMKGTQAQPMCGFSAQVVRILHQNSALAGGHAAEH